MMGIDNYLKVTPAQEAVRRKILRTEEYTATLRPTNWESKPAGFYGNLDAFMEYYESGNCAADYDALLLLQDNAFDLHLRVAATQYRNQIAVIPYSENVQQSKLPEEESSVQP